MGTKKIKKHNTNKYIQNNLTYAEESKLIKSDIKLTIGMLVSNRIKYIRNAMEALKPLLEAVPSELIVVDTKGTETDGSIDVVREYTEKIYPFTWCNDFSAARNVCFEHARGEWFLYVDDDEWFDDVTELIAFFNGEECEKYNAGCYYIREYNLQNTYSISIARRIIRRRENTKFEGMVHETFNEWYPPMKQFSCFTHHYGYALNDEDAKKHRERNVSILKQELMLHGAQPRLCAQMVQELIYFPDTMDGAYAFAMDALEKFKRSGEDYLAAASAQWVMLSTIRYFAMKQDLAGAKKQLEMLESKYNLSEITCLCMAATMVNLASTADVQEDILKYAKWYLKSWDWKCQQREEDIMHLVSLDMPKFYTKEYYYQMILLGARAANQMNLYEDAKKMWDRMPWGKVEFDPTPYIEERRITIEGWEKQQNRENTEESPLIKSDIKLTIGMLVSNRIQYIRNAMEALKPLLEAVPSELIVVDTKGAETDGSIDIVREYTDKIYPFVWCNDFSAARNVCFEHAQGEWFLYVDDDEWFDDVTEFIEFFNGEECEKYNAGWYYTRDYDLDGTYSSGLAGRIIRRRENTRFVGRVHESFNKLFSPIKQFSCFTHHYGYAFKDEAEAKKHQERNVSILKKELVEHGTVPRLCAQMVQELIFLPSSRNAGYNFAMDALRRFEVGGEEHLADSCAQWVMLSTVRYFAMKKDLAGAKEQFEFLESKYKLNEITRLCIAGVITNLAWAELALVDMLKYARMYLKQWEWKCQRSEEDIMALVNLDMPKFYDIEYCYRVIFGGATAANRMGLYEEAEKLWNKMPWEEEGFNARPYIKEREVTLNELKKQQEEISIQTHTTVEMNQEVEAPKWIQSDVKLTIGMLVSNHIQYIEKAMEALKPLLEAVPSELIVVDTKGEETDGSIDVIRRYTDKIYPFTWCNDFSAARNVCIDHARGEWFLYVDDDEWFDDVQEFIDFFNSGECENYYAGQYYTRDYLPGGGYSMAIAGRMIHRSEATRFVGRVHETFNECYLPIKVFSCFTHHYGYAYENEEARVAKQKRNVDILKEEICDKGLTPHRAAQMVQELLIRKETAKEAYQLSMEYIPILEQQGELMHSCSQWLLTASVRYFTESEQYKQLLEQAEWIQKYPLTETAQMVLAVVVVFSAIAEDDYEAIEKYTDMYLRSWDWCQENKELAQAQTQLDFPKFCTEIFYWKIIYIAATMANYKEEYERANKYWKRMPWGREDFDARPYQDELNATIRGIQEAKDKKYEGKLEKLIPLVNILAEASEQVKMNFLADDEAEAKLYLTGMQEAAISLGTNLDELIGEGSTTVALLEQYCELLWNCNNAEDKETHLALADMLCEATKLISDSFAKETRRQKTILLLPRKAEEWEFFEPYWKEAKRMGDKVFVIPVPYFEKMADGSRGKDEFCDAEQFPEQLAITRYSKYNYAGKRADLIVAKADYNDEQVSYTVHPFYYIENLKQYARVVDIVDESNEKDIDMI